MAKRAGILNHLACGIGNSKLAVACLIVMFAIVHLVPIADLRGSVDGWRGWERSHGGMMWILYRGIPRFARSNPDEWRVFLTCLITPVLLIALGALSAGRLIGNRTACIIAIVAGIVGLAGMLNWALGLAELEIHLHLWAYFWPVIATSVIVSDLRDRYWTLSTCRRKEMRDLKIYAIPTVPGCQLSTRTLPSWRCNGAP